MEGMKCVDCDNYNRGKGIKSCLKCPQYRDIIKQSGKRHTIAIDVIPDVILEAIPDNNGITLEQAIRQLPIDLSTPLLQYHILQATTREIGAYHNYNASTATRKINIAIEIIKKMIISE
jgi:DNA-directed RNA polymerase specialized sigma24 family protein